MLSTTLQPTVHRLLPTSFVLQNLTYSVSYSLFFYTLNATRTIRGYLFFLLILGFSHISSPTLSQNYPPKREFRGVWVASVNNTDWPSSPGLTSEEQQQEFSDLLTFQKANGMNAVIVQIRPNADALYRSSYEPWSRWLTGKEGKAPDPEYDPLEFMITECRRQQMEFHAWINPFRAIYNNQEGDISDEHVFFQHPDWVIPYGEHSYFDPGLPEVREYVLKIVMDVVNRYDIDGLHFDNSFYPSQIDSVAFLDDLSFTRYGENFDTLSDWRRNNINQFIQAVHDSIEAVKPQVRLGVSPSGVWRNQAKDPQGSDTQTSQTSYDDFYVDVLTWLKNGWIDYVAPQLYFSIGSEQADYRILLDWWVKNTYGKELYIGHAAYKIGLPEDSLWNDPWQITDQIELNRQSFQVDGSIFFSASSFLENPLSINSRLGGDIYQYPALVPSMAWNRMEVPDPPQSVSIARNKNQVLLQWQHNAHQNVRYYVVYGAEGEEAPNISDPTTIIAKTYFPNLTFMEGSVKGVFRKPHTFVVTAVNRNHDESLVSEPVQVQLLSLP
uniref:Family 10 glycosylhydrolase n=1 Tax=Roseihalotalea indica TaxID=2867963 RepID=A0AA49JKM2_9BACT|nr:family 10 glycosylhydrolase [Tunicatimonas sp. TK19036]